MKLRLLTILTIASSTVFAQSNNPDGIGLETNTTVHKTSQQVKIQAGCDTTFYDNLEAGNTNKWTINTGSKNVTTTNPAAGVYSLEHTGSSAHTNGIQAAFTVATPTKISYYVKATSLASANSYFVVGGVNTTTATSIIFAYMNSSSNLRFYSNGSNQYNHPIVLNQWYFVEFRNIDFTAKTFDIYVDNVLLQSGFAFRDPTATSVSEVHLYNLNANVIGTYDNIAIGEPGPSANFVTTDILCNGDTTGAIDLTPSGGNAPYSFDWNTNDTIEDLSGLTAGNYIITLTDDSGCVAIDSVMITEPTAIAVTTDSLGSFLCNGDSTGAIFTTSSGGTPGYSYLWNTNDTVDDLTGLVAGTYMLSVTDSNNCVHVETINLTQPDTISGNATVVPESISGNDGSIDQSTSGGTPGYTYNWSTSDTTEDISGLTTGTYTVTITDANGCSKVIVYEVLSSVGINQYSVVDGIRIFPNPANGNVNVSLAHPTAIEIFNAIGQQVMLVNNNNTKFNLDVSSLVKGVYYLKAGEQTKRLVIK